jgi:uncharacterized protein (DUF486 family)
MTYAWYGHLKSTTWTMPKAIVVSWCIAFFEYCFMVPANRLGYKIFSAFQLKIIQEVISIGVFILFAYFMLGERLKWNYFISFIFILLAAWFAFYKD